MLEGGICLKVYISSGAIIESGRLFDNEFYKKESQALWEVYSRGVFNWTGAFNLLFKVTGFYFLA